MKKLTQPVLPVISLLEARRIALRSQGLADDPAPFGSGKSGALRAVQHLGYVQVDTISVVQRAHHHVLWSRVPEYVPEMLHELQDPDHTVFEYWNHAASYLPMNDFRFSLPLMRRYRGETHWGDETPELKRAKRRVLQLVRRKGPLLLRDVESKEFIGGWSNAAPSKIEKRALHELWMRGQVMIRSRQGFQKVFDLPERILPEDTDHTVPTKTETAEFHIRRALRALGVARVSELHYLQETERASLVKSVLLDLVERGEVIELRVAEFPNVPCFALPAALKMTKPLEEKRLQILSPFDNLVIQRDRLRWLFGFDYIIECYVPAAKRRFGYFVLPILFGEQFIGRMDAKADRANRVLHVHNLVFETTFQDFKSMRPIFNDALKKFAQFQGCERIEFAKIEPASARNVFSAKRT